MECRSFVGGSDQTDPFPRLLQVRPTLVVATVDAVAEQVLGRVIGRCSVGQGLGHVGVEEGQLAVHLHVLAGRVHRQRLHQHFWQRQQTQELGGALLNLQRGGLAQQLHQLRHLGGTSAVLSYELHECSDTMGAGNGVLMVIQSTDQFTKFVHDLHFSARF